MTLGACLGQVAPYYNLVLVAIMIALFLKLFKTPNKQVYILPWKFLFFSILVYVVEEILTVLQGSNLITVPNIIYPVLEMIIITSFVYMVLIQKNYIGSGRKTEAKKAKKGKAISKNE